MTVNSEQYPLIQSPGDWFPRGIAMDCLWYEQYEGNDLCSKKHIPIHEGPGEECFLCPDYSEYVKGASYKYEDKTGQYYIPGM